MNTPLTLAVIAPFDYQPFRSILALSRLIQQTFAGTPIEVIPVTPPSFLGNITQGVPAIHRYVAAFERLTLSPMILRGRMTTLQRTAKKQGRRFAILFADQSLAVLAPALNGFTRLAFVSDLISYRASLGQWGQPHGFAQRFAQQAMLTGLSACEGFITPSQATASDLASILPAAQRITTIAPLYTTFAPPPADTQATALAQLWRTQQLLPRPYLLHVGSAAWYKNRPGLIHICAQLKRLTPTPPALVFAGAAPTPLEQALITQHQIAFHHFGNISDAELNTLYGGADAVVLPSFIEGFCWPALEAISCGTPLIISDTAALIEHFGPAASIVIPALGPDANLADITPWATTCATEIMALWQTPQPIKDEVIHQAMAHAATFTPLRFRTQLTAAITSAINAP